MAETKADLEAKVAELTGLVQKLQATGADPDVKPSVIDAEGQAALRQAVADFREVEQTPPGQDRIGVLAAAGQTLANRVEGVLNS